MRPHKEERRRLAEVARRAIARQQKIMQLPSRERAEALRGQRTEKAVRVISNILAARGKQYLPNRIYTAKMFVYFQKKWDKLRSQEQAYDKTTKEFALDPLKGESFIRQFRIWRDKNRK